MIIDTAENHGQSPNFGKLGDILASSARRFHLPIRESWIPIDVQPHQPRPFLNVSRLSAH